MMVLVLVRVYTGRMSQSGKTGFKANSSFAVPVLIFAYSEA